MSSPPPSATSPSFSGNLQLPKKRPSLGVPIPSQNAKRRKQSSLSSGAHPLRQTSFPAPGASPGPFTASPTRGSSFSPSVSSVGARGGGHKKRRSIARSATAASAAKSATGDGDASGKGREATTRGMRHEDEEAEEEDEDEGAGDTVLEGGGKMDEAAQKQEAQHLAMLIDTLDGEQNERYSTWKRVRLRKETVRKITNQTLSQSVPPSIVTTINGYTKVFVGELLERARDVQTEWIAADHLASSNAATSTNSSSTSTTKPNGESADASSSTIGMTYAGTSKKDPSRVEERDRGPLTPDHLREALRRYKKDREGGSAGFQGLSMTGKEATASRTGGRRLFR